MENPNLALTAEELAMLQADAASATDTTQRQLTVVKHDLAAEDVSIGFNDAALDMINERFSRQLRAGLVDVLRTTPRIQIEKVKTVRYQQWLQDLKAPLSVNTIKIDPLRGYSLVIIEPSVIFSSLDNFFGGLGKGSNPVHPGRMFTPTENSIIRIMLNIIFASLKEAWSPILQLDFTETAAEINPQFAQIADENDLVIVSRFVLSMDANASEGTISIVTPFISLKPIRDLLRSRIQSSEENDAKDTQWREELADASGHAKLRLLVNLGQIFSSLGELQAMEVGDILFFKKPEFATGEIEGAKIFTAEVGNIGNNVAVKIKDFVQIPPIN